MTVTVNTVIVDEQLQARGEALLDVLRRDLGVPGLEYSQKPASLVGGFWAELVKFQLADPPTDWDQPMVARIMPDAGIAAKEAAIQAEVARAGYPTPAVHLFDGPERGIDGRSLMVMDLASGGSPLDGLGGGAAIGSLPSLARRLPRLLADVLARLHRVDPTHVIARLESESIPRPDIDSMLDSFDAASKGFDDHALRRAVEWLKAHRPAGEPEVVCHGDMHPFNVLVDSKHNPTVLDWSAAVIAPRGYDLGFTSLMLAEPPLEAPPIARPLIRFLGGRLSNGFLRAYRRQSEVKVSRESLAWYQSLICVRALTEIAWWDASNTIADHAGHPWLINQRGFIKRLRGTTGEQVRPIVWASNVEQ